jgi:regulator of protease activity HflC (stomatin/prohibitin superfamily)
MSNPDSGTSKHAGYPGLRTAARLTTYAALGVGATVGILQGVNGWNVVDRNERGIIQTFGQPTRVVDPGLRFSWFYQTMYKYPQGLIISDDVQESFRTIDNQHLLVNASLHYRLTGAHNNPGPEDKKNTDNRAAETRDSELIDIHTQLSKRLSGNPKDSTLPIYDSTLRNLYFAAAREEFSQVSIVDTNKYDEVRKKILLRLKTNIANSKLPYLVDQVILLKAEPDAAGNAFATRIANERQKKLIIEQQGLNAASQRVTNEKEAEAQAAGNKKLFELQASFVQEYATANGMSTQEAMSMYNTFQTYDFLKDREKVQVFSLGTQSLPLALGSDTLAPQRRPIAPLPAPPAAPAPGKSG